MTRSIDELTDHERQMLYEVATEQVRRGRTPEFACRQYGHFDCAFSEGGSCSDEAIDREMGRMLTQLERDPR